MKRRRHREKGFTLIEVMVASLVLMMGLLFLLNMQMVAAHGNVTGRRVTEANVLAKNCMDRLKGLDFDDADLAPGEHVDSNNPLSVDDDLVESEDEGEENEEDYGNKKFTRTWSVTGDVNMKTVATTVSWSHRKNHSIAVSTIITR